MIDSMSAEEFRAQQRKGHKYHAEPTEVDGIRFDSKAEARRYGELKLMEQAGAIRDLVLQQRFDLTVNGVKIGQYVADFVYTDNRDGSVIVEDTKGYRTPLYRWKKRHMRAQYGIEILETQEART